MASTATSASFLPAVAKPAADNARSKSATSWHKAGVDDCDGAARDAAAGSAWLAVTKLLSPSCVSTEEGESPSRAVVWAGMWEVSLDGVVGLALRRAARREGAMNGIRRVRGTDRDGGLRTFCKENDRVKGVNSECGAWDLG
jgi:hypothetical protein